MKCECGTCRFWKSPAGKINECRIRAPQTVAQIDGYNGDAGLCIDTRLVTRWPETHREDWCGEWEPEPAVEE